MTTQKTLATTLKQAYNNSRFGSNHPKTAKEAIKLAKLDWVVEQYPLAYRGNTGKYHPVTGRFSQANVHSRTGEALGVVGSRYVPIQNVDAFSFADELIGSKEAVFIGGGAFQGGRMVWLQAKLPKDLILFKEDVVERIITLVTSHDGSLPLIALFTPNRIACTNQLVRLKRQITVRHTSLFKSKVSESRRIMGFALDFYKEFETNANAMQSLKLNETKVRSYFNDLLEINPKTEETEASSRKIQTRDRLFQLFEKGQGNTTPHVRGTLWAAYNAVTEFADHFSVSRNGEEDATNRLRASWFGTTAEMKDRAFNQALELVSVRN